VVIVVSKSGLGATLKFTCGLSVGGGAISRIDLGILNLCNSLFIVDFHLKEHTANYDGHHLIILTGPPIVPPDSSISVPYRP
jgi:hypothetical protein